ncbi:P1 family peptidase [Aurantimonas sp. MSK8Z-1]|uniref:P1 family peptidase n=1 Tax=Mangrovibrevibacter kandeliae TaxID=2968473 RepID=UPI002117533F|nr:P1 family peptidase [Aurantimonas sp. MSK8Z-1]MCW4114446.1 P1 family peptidase [Aurantimonas sp. MSK8Z-1]
MTHAFAPGPRNGLTDVAGLAVGHADDERLRSGTTAILCDTPAVAAVDVRGGAPGTRETDLLRAGSLVPGIDALFLSGGSAFGLDAATGVQAWLREQGRGFEVRGQHVPIVPGAILFDLANGGDKAWGRFSPYRDLGYAAAARAGQDVALGSVGAGLGATTATGPGGLGSASVRLPNGITVAALVAVNAVGSATIGDTAHFWSAPFEIGDEFGGRGLPHPLPVDAMRLRLKGDPAPNANTTLGVVATDAVLMREDAGRLAIAAHDGYARALWPAHTDFDGDLVFALATGRSGHAPEPRERLTLQAAATAAMARAIARGVHLARLALGHG